MPVVIFEAANLSLEQKALLTKEFTESVCSIAGYPKEHVFIFIKENPLSNVSVGGVLLDQKSKSLS